MTTQRDRLAAVLADAMWGEGAEKDGEGWKQRADALLARGVRVVDAGWCPKCGSADCKVWYVEGRMKRLAENRDFLHHVCKECGYPWKTKAMDAEP